MFFQGMDKAFILAPGGRGALQGRIKETTKWASAPVFRFADGGNPHRVEHIYVCDNPL
jgi:hypothetical protein